jgi:hypothetical protein
MDLAEALEPLVVNRGQQVLLGQQLGCECLLLEDAVEDKYPNETPYR